ncbi:MAG: phenylalanyl--tRNA ligase subunit alpha, partial [Desulfurococcaceae archaeon]|nr:phenylalanyl--tRNA ligase subunit alpha [Desulfurococcaceae archaeon]
MQPIFVAPRQYRILEVVVETRGVNAGELASRLGVRQEDLMRDLVELEARGLITTSKSLVKYYVLSETGKQYLQMGLPEEIVYSHLLNFTGRSIDELINYIASTRGIPRDEVLIGLQYLVRGGCILIEKK